MPADLMGPDSPGPGQAVPESDSPGARPQLGRQIAHPAPGPDPGQRRQTAAGLGRATSPTPGPQPGRPAAAAGGRGPARGVGIVQGGQRRVRQVGRRQLRLRESRGTAGLLQVSASLIFHLSYWRLCDNAASQLLWLLV